MTAKFFQTLLEYNRWANHLILNKAAQAPAADYFAQAPGLSFESLHGTLVHAFAAEVVWLARWQGGLPPEHLRDARAALVIASEHIKSFEDLRALWAEEDAKQAKFIETLTDAQIAAPISYKTQYGEANRQPLVELIGHFINHGTQFRTEASVRLSQLGLSPGDLDLIIFLRQRS